MNEWGPRIKSYPPSVFFSPPLSFSRLPLRALRLPFPGREWNRVGVIKSTYLLLAPSLSARYPSSSIFASFETNLSLSLFLSLLARVCDRDIREDILPVLRRFEEEV